jgi:hypothetical protein
MFALELLQSDPVCIEFTFDDLKFSLCFDQEEVQILKEGIELNGLYIEFKYNNTSISFTRKGGKIFVEYIHNEPNLSNFKIKITKNHGYYDFYDNLMILLQ